VAHLEDPPGDLVRKDSLFKKLGLDPDDFVSPDAVVDVIARHKMLMQRPVVVRRERAIIGRPKQRVVDFLAPPERGRFRERDRGAGCGPLSATLIRREEMNYHGIRGMAWRLHFALPDGRQIEALQVGRARPAIRDPDSDSQRGIGTGIPPRSLLIAGSAPAPRAVVCCYHSRPSLRSDLATETKWVGRAFEQSRPGAPVGHRLLRGSWGGESNLSLPF